MNKSFASKQHNPVVPDIFGHIKLSPGAQRKLATVRSRRNQKGNSSFQMKVIKMCFLKIRVGAKEL